MSAPRHAELARRLFASVRREGPSAELRQRIQAAGRAELARKAEPARERALQPPRHTPTPLARRWLAVAGLAVAAAVALADLELGATPQRDVLISAERSGAAAATHGSSERDPRAPVMPVPPAVPASDGPSRDVDESPRPSLAPATPEDVASRQRSPTPEPPASRPESPDARVATPPARMPPAPAVPDGAATSPDAPRLTLGQQLEKLKTARAALRDDDPQRALQLLDAYRAQPGGADMAAEASLLRIEALAASGQHDAAAQAARQFASDYPNSPLIDRALSYAGGSGR
ncbi:MAG TPA: hypothetical protein VMG12_08845 [Polyangiaceae bacterium]|nr:hypothetical protein [Polyangiaceae bacterium]